MSALAEHGVELPIPPDGPVVRMVDQEMVREQFYMHTPADGTPEQKGRFRRQRFLAGARLGRTETANRRRGDRRRHLFVLAQSAERGRAGVGLRQSVELQSALWGRSSTGKFDA